MPDKVFIDTNIFFYLYSADEPEKRQKAEKALNGYECITSTQAINELCNILIKKMKLPTKQIKAAIVEIYSFCNVVNVEREIIEEALNLQQIYGYSYYDSLMLSAALLSGCKQIFTEDMQNNQIINNSLTIANIIK